jgi:UDP-glucose 4-epimerase
VYGESKAILTEDSRTNPVNFYGFSKLEFERLIEWYNKIYGLDYVALRYFNVAGDELGYVDINAKNVFPIIMDKIKSKKPFVIFGDNYSTKDGTSVRDYVDVRDLVDSHILALESSFEGMLNLGSGKGYSVKQLVKFFKEVSKINFKVKIKARRKGDLAKVIASNKKAKDVLRWKPKHSLRDMVESALEAYEWIKRIRKRFLK